MSSRKRLAIIQSSYIPWKGYFDAIAAVDEFILLDDAQYTKRDWRNRNRIKPPTGAQWLTIPVQVKGRFEQRIDETLVADPGWAEKHWATLVNVYRRAGAFDEVAAWLGAAYEAAGREERLSDVNRALMTEICGRLGITTPIRWSTDYGVEGTRGERILNLCLAAGADTYYSGPSAQAYMDVDAFAAAGVRVEWLDYSGYPEYQQFGTPFEHTVSIVDLLFHTGRRAREYLKA